MDFSEMYAANLEAFGEAATYRKAAGTTRAITILPFRRQPVASQQQPGVLEGKTGFFCLNSATSGITAGELQLQSDEILFPERVGGTARAWQIKDIAGQDLHGLVLEVDG
jgi:hypothetical protein